jgi:CHAT domain-containing protein/tetratricopeptide (TPR) repeat protein
MRVKPRFPIAIALVLAAAPWLPSAAMAQDEGIEMIQRAGGWVTQAFDLSQRGRFKQLEDLVRSVVRELDTQSSPNLVSLSSALAMLSDACQQQGNYEESERAAQRALTIARATGDPKVIAAALQALAAVHDSLERFSEAEREIRQALEIYRQNYPPDSVVMAEGLENLAVILVHTFRFLDAEPVLKRVLAIRHQKLGPRSSYVGDAYFNLAVTYERQERWQAAEPYLRAALQVYEAAGSDSDRLQLPLLHLVMLCTQTQRWEEAHLFYDRLMAEARRRFGPSHPKTLDLETYLGYIYLGQGRSADAAAVYQQALRHGDEAVGQYAAHILRGELAETYIKLGRFAEAESLASRTIEGLRSKPANEGPLRWAHSVRAKARYLLDDRVGAIDDLRVAVRLAEQARSNIAGSEHERAHTFATSFRDDYVLLTRALLEAGDPAEALVVAERGRARALVDQMETAHADLLAGLEATQADALRESLHRAQARVSQLEKQRAAIDADPSVAAAQRQQKRASLDSALELARRQLVEAHTEVQNASPAYRQALSRDFQPAPLARIDQWLAENQFQLLYYNVNDQGVFVITVGPQANGSTAHFPEITEEQAAVLGVRPGPLTGDVLAAVLQGPEGILPSLSTPGPHPETIARLAALWQILVPAGARNALLGGDCRGLVVVPDGALTSFPFETLVVESGETTHYLLDGGPPLLYAPSATVLLNLAERSAGRAVIAAGRQPVLSIANPVYGQTAALEARQTEPAARGQYRSAGGALADLPFSGTESSWVADVFKKQGVTVAALRRELATEHNVRGNLSGRRMVHFACHGLADQAYGNFFGCLALTPGQRATATSADDGFLMLPEIYELKLKDCELAILSACQTNYGPQQKGEGVWALSRGFLVAGARRVVASNWLVDDEAAASLISVFCSDLAKAEGQGHTPDYAAALHRAKRWVRGQPKWASPYYWGTFVLVGPN